MLKNVLKSIFLPTWMWFWLLSPLGGWHYQSTATRAGPWLSDRKQQDPSSWEVQHSRNWKGFCGQAWQKCCFLPELPASLWGCRVSWPCVTQGNILIYRAPAGPQLPSEQSWKGRENRNFSSTPPPPSVGEDSKAQWKSRKWILKLDLVTVRLQTTADCVASQKKTLNWEIMLYFRYVKH